MTNTQTSQSEWEFWGLPQPKSPYVLPRLSQKLEVLLNEPYLSKLTEFEKKKVSDMQILVFGSQSQNRYIRKVKERIDEHHRAG